MTEQMKSSGIDWIGDIPESWSIKRIKYCTDMIMGQSPDSNLIKEDNGIYPFMQGNAEFTNLYPKPSLYCDFPNKVSRVGDILMSVRAPVGELNISDREYGIGRGLCSIRPAYFNTKYFWYFMLKSKGDFSVFSNGSTFEAITTENLLNFPCVVPGIQEQQAIADFLDKECAQIDSIATDLEKQIALLQQYKKALITETVSKGLDKSVPVKDSGIEWIGKIPAHWDVEPIKYRVTFHNGDRGENYPTKSELQSEGIPFINAGHLEGDGLNMDNMDYISEEKYRIMGGVKLRSGDILYCLRGSVGKNAIVDMNQGTVASSLVAIRSVRISAEYLYYCLNSHIEEVQRYWWDNGTAQPNLSADNLGKYKICIPPVEEQKAIVKYLNNICSQIDNLIIGKKKQLSTIQQHKKSLIYEYVTGKKRVKEAQ